MERSLFRYIWRHSRRDQMIIFAVVLASLPFYFASLDLPRRIVNEAIQGRAFMGGNENTQFLTVSLGWPSWLGGGSSVTVFEGFTVDRLGLLFGLSGVFLALVVVNGAFKYYINVAKGALGERMLRRMRFDLFALILRFTPETLKTVKASETATIIKDEVEPLGGFTGDAFVTPLFLGTQALTALTFILIQNVWLGLMAAGVVGIQFAVIPRLRRVLLKLGKQRQLASRRLAGRVGEVVEGIEVVHVHNAHAWERAEIGHRLYELFDLRFRIYRWKFMVKFLNNFLAQVTPFLFYAIGGYLALRGRLDIGQLVAVIAAYRELPPPLKELIDWDQQRLDVQVKYEQVVQHFSPERLLPAEQEAEDTGERLAGPLKVEDLTVADPHSGPLLEGIDLEIPLPTRLGLVSDGGPAAGLFARIVARRHPSYTGRIRYGERDLSDVPTSMAGRCLSYAGVDPVLFPGSIRDNIVYGLRQRVVERATLDKKEAARRRAEALRTGNPVETVEDVWIDHRLAGVESAEELDDRVIELLRRLGLEDDVYRFGLSGMVDRERHPDLAAALIEARARLREKLVADGLASLVAPFDRDHYNPHATIAENLLFGVPRSKDLMGRALAEQPAFRGVMEREDLVPDLVAMGEKIAATMTEIFRGLPMGHPLFEQFSFLSADELPEFEQMLRRRTMRGRITRDDENRLFALPLGYIEPRHRLGLLDEGLQQRLVEARAKVRAAFERFEPPKVEFYDPDSVAAGATLRDNLLFGRINHSFADAQARVRQEIIAVVAEMGLQDQIKRVGLDHQVGPGGRLLTAQQRALVSLARSVVKRPDLLVIDGALAPFNEARSRALLDLIIELTEGRSLMVTLPNDANAAKFEAVLRFKGAGVTFERGGGEEPRPAEERPVERERLTAAGE